MTAHLTFIAILPVCTSLFTRAYFRMEVLDPDNKENQNPYASLEYGLAKEEIRKRLK